MRSSAFRACLWLAFASLCLAGCALDPSPMDADAAVRSTSAALTAPDTSCAWYDFSGQKYWFCSNARSWQLARTKCQALGTSFNLASIQSAAEDAFVRSHLAASAWAAGTDSAVEGAWRWTSTNMQFWQGSAGGSAVGGAYTNWNSGQPNNTINQDCLVVEVGSGGKWRDEACEGLLPYVCKGDGCPADPAKTDPGQCGCGVPDTDSDGDGTANCNDACPVDPSKIAAGQCGCGNVDSDFDGDGSADCVDACDEDQGRTVAPCSPDVACSHASFQGSEYFFCDSPKSWWRAKAKCEAVGLRLTRIESSAENTFIRQHILTDRWIGGADTATEGAWRWQIGDVQFWQGAAGGAPVGGAYTNWHFGEPNDLLDQDCVQIEGDGKWMDDRCSATEQFVCEAADDCPSDPNKFQPGQCGCGVADTDHDGDGVASCVDGCPNDPRNDAPGDCGCADAPAPQGTACNDGICAAASECDGSGVCGSSPACAAPDTSCQLVIRAGTPYWFCANARQHADARKRCQSVGMDLAEPDTSAEDTFLAAHVSGHTYLGGSDQAVEGAWRWLTSGTSFWSGNAGGSNVNRAYANWEDSQPSDSLSTFDCMVKDPTWAGGRWETRKCSDAFAYACEGVALPGSDLTSCVDKVKPREDLTGVERERAYQADLLKYCAAVGDPKCLQDLRARVNLDYFAASVALMSQQSSPAQFLAIERDRDRKATAFEASPALANALCAGDTDGDFIANGTDACPNTPPMTPTNDVGCTDSTLPAGPSAADVTAILDHTGVALNASCTGAAPLPKSPLGGFYWPSDLARGVFVFASRVSNQPAGCPVWYVFDIEETVNTGTPPGYEVVRRYRVAFQDAEEALALMGEPASVPGNAIQFRVLATDTGSRFQLASAGAGVLFGAINGVRFRVKVVNGGGMQSGWSAWRFTAPGDCERLGFSCQ